MSRIKLIVEESDDGKQVEKLPQLFQSQMDKISYEEAEVDLVVKSKTHSFVGLRSYLAFCKGVIVGLKCKGIKVNIEGATEPDYDRPPNAVANIKQPIVELTNVCIDFATINDISIIAQIEEELFSREKWSTESIRLAMDRDDCIFFTIKENQTIVGTCYLYLPKFKDDVVEVMSIGIKKDYQSCGYGKKLLSYAINYVYNKQYQKVHLNVRSSNKTAQNLYSKLGFEPINEVRNFYVAPPENAIVMQLKF